MEHVAGTPGLLNVAWIASVTAFAVSMSASPGPNNTMLAASGASWGFRRTIPHIAGVSVGFPTMLMMVALGAGTVLRDQPWIHETLRWVGAAYLVWLAWRIATARPDEPAGSGGSRPLGFIGAAAFQWVNPKAWIIALGAVVTYTGQGGAVMQQALLIAVIFLIVTFGATALWTLVGVGAGRLFRSPRARRGFNLAMAGLLLGSLLSLLHHE